MILLMSLNLINWISNVNPQIYRELIGRFTSRNFWFVGIVSFIAYSLFFLWIGITYVNSYPNDNHLIYGEYCDASLEGFSSQDFDYKTDRLWNLGIETDYSNNFNRISFSPILENFTRGEPLNSPEITKLKQSLKTLCPQDKINRQKWWENRVVDEIAEKLFIIMSVAIIFLLLVIGSFMLIVDLNQEESQGHLNFIRLSPQSSWTIFGGKLLGVPILLYAIISMTLPVHLWAGMVSGISLLGILGLYLTIVISCLFFYSGALLFSLVGSWLGGFQGWLGSGMLLAFQSVLTLMMWNGDKGDNYAINYLATDWLNLFCPTTTLTYLVKDVSNFNDLVDYFQYFPRELRWYNHQVNFYVFILLTLINYLLWFFWIKKALTRRFRNRNATILSKKDSYFVTSCFTFCLLGFILHDGLYINEYHHRQNLVILFFFNIVFFLGLIAALSPERQTLQDWIITRKSYSSSRTTQGRTSLLTDLVKNDKSPPFMAISINVFISSLIVIILMCWEKTIPDIFIIFCLIFFCSSILIYAALVQLILFMNLKRREIWVIVFLIMTTLIMYLILFLIFFLAVLILSIFTGLTFDEIINNSADQVFYGLIIGGSILITEWLVLGLLVFLLIRRFKKALRP